MKKGVGFSAVLIVLLVVAVVAMSIGFAVFSQNLNINGTATVASSNWNVQFKTDSYQESVGSVQVDTGNRTLNATSMTFDVDLAKPGDFYEFTVTVENAGTLNAYLSGITMSTLDEDQQKYLKYQITYDNGSTYTTTTSSLNNDLASGATADVKVRVEYIQPAVPEDLPTDGPQEITLTATLNYLQKTA